MSPESRSRSGPARLLTGLFFLLVPLAKPLLKATLGHNQRLWRRLSGVRDGLIEGPPPAVGLEAPFARRLLGLLGGASPAGVRERPFGVNLAGYLTSEKGTGEAARSTAEILSAAGIPLALNNVLDTSSTNNETPGGALSEDNPFAINLVFVNADQAANFAWHKGEEYFQGRYTIGVWNWELTDFPSEWLHRFEYYDEIWVATDFVRDALAPISPVPVTRIPYALPPRSPEATRFGRSQFGVPSDKFFFLFMFDFHSVMERKNPLGLIRTFRQAFRNDGDAVLVIKSSRADSEAIRVLRHAAGDANIKIMEDVLTRDEVTALYDACDCYVSLHRSEGFGLTLAEAMAAGKPTIGTAYGGNVDFMTAENSLLVNYKLIEIDRDYPPYQKGWHWADPDIDEAARLMRRVYDRRDEGRALGRRARDDIARLLSPRTIGEAMKQRLLEIAAQQGVAIPDASTTDARAMATMNKEAV